MDGPQIEMHAPVLDAADDGGLKQVARASSKSASADGARGELASASNRAAKRGPAVDDLGRERRPADLLAAAVTGGDGSPRLSSSEAERPPHGK